MFFHPQASCVAALVLLATVTSPCSAETTSPRNIVLLFVDDLGWTDIQGRNPKFETPNINRLSEQSVEFTQAYVATPACSPSRATLLTGQHPARLQIVRHVPTGPKHPSFDSRGRTDDVWNQFDKDPGHVPSRNWLPLERVTYAEALKTLGYQTHFVGKWHLGHEPYHPTAQGFDTQFGTTNFGHPKSYRAPFFQHTDVLQNETDGYLTDRLTDETVRLIHAATDQPFLISHWFYGVHKPHVGRTDLVAEFEERGLEGNELHYAAMLKALDEAVGRILKALDETGQADRTALFLTSDQGSWFENPPYRGSKRTDPLCEGSARVPFLVRVPGVTQAGTKNHSVVQTTDLFPTFVEIAGGDPTRYSDLDGVSLWPTIRSGGTLQRHEPLFGYRAYEDVYATVRQGPWKLFVSRGGEVALYDVENDRYEQHDVAAAQPEIVHELTAQLIAWEQTVGVADYSGVQ